MINNIKELKNQQVYTKILKIYINLKNLKKVKQKFKKVNNIKEDLKNIYNQY
jgi:hypothetical protein